MAIHDHGFDAIDGVAYTAQKERVIARAAIERVIAAIARIETVVPRAADDCVSTITAREGEVTGQDREVGRDRAGRIAKRDGLEIVKRVLLDRTAARGDGAKPGGCVAGRERERLAGGQRGVIDRVVPRAAVQRVTAGPAADRIRAAGAHDRVIARPTIEPGAGRAIAHERIGALRADNAFDVDERIDIAGSGREGDGRAERERNTLRAADSEIGIIDRIATHAAIERVIAKPARKRVIAGIATDGIGAAIAHDCIGTDRSGDVLEIIDLIGGIGRDNAIHEAREPVGGEIDADAIGWNARQIEHVGAAAAIIGLIAAIARLDEIIARPAIEINGMEEQ